MPISFLTSPSHFLLRVGCPLSVYSSLGLYRLWETPLKRYVRGVCRLCHSRSFKTHPSMKLAQPMGLIDF